MKNIRLLLLLVIVVMLSGCTVTSNIKINPNGSVNESVSILNSNKIFGSKENAEEVYNRMLQENLQILTFKEYDYNFKSEDNMSGGEFNKKYDNLCDYFGNSAFNQYVYKYMDCKETDEYYEIKNATDQIPYCEECSDWPALGDITLNIILPISATEQNADEINNNTYTWKYDKSTTNKNFYLKVSKADLKANEIVYKQKIKRNKKIKTGVIITVIILVLAGLAMFGVYMYKKSQKNKFDY